ncbi:MAG: UvrD-helicase domain-containing protein [Candidatus Hydrogenedentes bacterium]|nr:UvrD-helicase domain-containing protein [Candidatus Hydrogenedentota bacterium]
MSRTPSQRRAIETTGLNLCVDAGAGSGKTSVLVDRIIHLIEHDNVPLDAIVAITFTDKAAAEMKERLRRECHRRAPADDPAKMTFWRTLERRTDSARISTIHAFCMGLLKENALSLGMDPDFAMLSDAESHLIRTDTVNEVLREMLQADDEAAMRLATVYGIPLLKTVLESMLKDRSALERLLALENIRSAEEMLARWRERVRAERLRLLRDLQESRDLAGLRLQLESYAGACAKPEDGREQMRVKLLEIVSTIRDRTDCGVLCDAASELAACDARRGSKKNWSSEDAYEGVKEARDALKSLVDKHRIPSCEAEIESESAQITFDLIGVFGRVLEGLRSAKRLRTAFDFDDLIMETLKVLQDVSRGEDSVRARTARTIRHLLIDEFQDTDGAQLEIARLLAQSPGGPELFVVGDAKQSIYQFRGAEVDVFREARNEADETISLSVNFRSLPDVLEFVNDFFTKSDLLADVENPYVPMKTSRASDGGTRIEILMPESMDEAKAADYRDAEAQLLAGRIAEMCHGPHAISVSDPHSGNLRPARFGDVVVLLRSFSDVYQFERAFRLAGVPYAVVAGAGFYERQEVADFRNLLTVLDNPWNELALLGFLRGPMVGLSDDSLLELTRDSGLASAFHRSLSLSDTEQNGRLMNARILLSDLNSRRHEPLLELLRYALDRTGLEAIYLAQFLGVQRASNVRKILELATSYSRTSAPSLSAFVRYLDEVAAAEIREGEAAVQNEDANVVTVMTIHKSKGLEFPIVAIADMARGPNIRQSLPVTWHRHHGISAKTMGDDGEYQECPIYRIAQGVREREERAERSRILYVAMTRARDHLLLCGAPEQGHDRNNSWFAAFREQYALSGRSDGETITGKAWKAVIRRRPSGIRIPEIRTAPRELDREYCLRRVAPVDNPLLLSNSISVTQASYLIATQTDTVEETRSSGADRDYAMVRGTLAHKLLELWNVQSDCESLIPQLVDSAPVERVHRQWLREDLAFLLKRFGESPIASRLAADTVGREVSFALRLGAYIVHGVIDVLLADGTIVDYKTGQPHPVSLAHYENQVRLYAAALRALRNQQPPAAFLCYIDSRDENWIVPVDVSPPRVDETLAQVERALDARNGGSPG